jgi:hypothetical protein
MWTKYGNRQITRTTGVPIYYDTPNNNSKYDVVLTRHRVWSMIPVCPNSFFRRWPLVPGGYSGHEEYEGRQRHANEDGDTRLALSARAVGTRRNVDGGRRAKHAHGPYFKVGVVIVARRADHIVVVAYARACLGEYIRIASYVCKRSNRQFGTPGECCDSPKSG